AQPGHDRVVLAEIAREIDQRDRHPGAGDERAADSEAVVGTAVVDQHDLVAAGDFQRFERRHQLADAARAVIDGNDDAERKGRIAHGFIAVARIEPPKGSDSPAASSRSSSARMAPKARSSGAGPRATSLAAAPRRHSTRRRTMSGKSRLFQ